MITLADSTNGIDKFKEAMQHIKDKNISLTYWINIASDGTAATTGKLKGFVSGTKSDDPRFLYIHCIIHTHNLVVCNIGGDIQHVLNTAMHAIYFVKSNSVIEFS